MIPLSALLERAGVEPERLEGDAEVGALVDDARRAEPGALFVAMPRSHPKGRSGAEFVGQAKERGASAVLATDAEGFSAARENGVPAALVPPAYPLASVGRVCRAFFDDPTAQMRVIGVTGTNGKTTTAWITAGALRALGRRSAYLGTLGFDLGDGPRTLANTTPFPVLLWHLLHEAASAGIQDFVFETSSHALVQRRVAAVRYDVGALTNLSQDHLDFHGTMEAYADAKKLLFTEYARASAKRFRSVLPADDPYARAWEPDLPFAPLWYGYRAGVLRGEPLAIAVDGVRLRVHEPEGGAELALPLGGRFNVANALVAYAILRAAEVPPAEAAAALGRVRPAPGRFESVPNERGIGVLVDYAHTPDALVKVLSAARDLGPRQLWVVFGCGGDRDRTKRPLMGRAAETHADRVVVTSDNPRTEDPQAIIAEIVAGLERPERALIEPDRRSAVALAIAEARPGDVVVIAGKGHEDYQIIGTTKFPLDDRELAREALGARK